MKKYVSIALVVILGMGLYYIVVSNRNKPIINDKNFVLENTEKVTQISLEDRFRSKVVLTKKDNIWYVNDTFKAFAPQMNLFLNSTLNKIRVKGPVSKTAHETTIRKMVGKAIHVVLYEGDNVVRDYYVGESTPDNNGSYLHINGSKTPYIAHILGYNSILYPKFSVLASDWIDRTVFDYTPDQIASISVDYTQEPDESFTLYRNDSTYTISPSSFPINQVAAKSYFTLFSFKNFEGYAEYLTQEVKDSVKASIPFVTLRVAHIDGSIKSLRLFRKKSADGNTVYDKNGDPLVEDTERYFATFTGFSQLVTVQEYVFGKQLVKRSYWRE